MSTVNEQLAFIKSLADEVKSCKYILSGSKIVKLLKGISISPDLLKVIEEVSDGFNFEYEFLRAKVITKEDGRTKTTFTLPEEDDKIVALVFHVLFAIDSKSIDIQQFMGEYFYNEDSPNDTYKGCMTALIDPFIKSLEFLSTGVRPDEPKTIVKPKFDVSVAIAEKDVKEIQILVRKVLDLTKTQELSDLNKVETEIVSNGFGDAVNTLSKEQIVLTWIGFKNTVKDIKGVSPLIKKIEDKLRESEVFADK